MKYYLLGNKYKRLFVEEGLTSFKYDKEIGKWVYGGSELLDNRYGFDETEPIGSPYRYNNPACSEKIEEISKEEAEKFTNKEINEEELQKLFIEKLNENR